MDRKKNKTFTLNLILFLLLVIVISTLRLFFIRDYNRNKGSVVTVILRDGNEDRWTPLKSGLQQAADDRKIKLNYINAPRYITVEEEIEIINKASAASSAVICEAVDNDGMTEYMADRNNEKIPIVFVASGVDAHGLYPTVQGNNRLMGEMLGEKILEDYGNKIKDKKIGILAGISGESSQMERLEGITSVFQEKGVADNISFRLYSGNNIEKILRNRLLTEKTDILVCLDSFETDIAVDIIDSFIFGEDRNVKVYGCGYSENNIFDIDRGKLSTLIITNDFTEGYLAVDMVEKILNGKNIKEKNITVDSYMVTKEALDNTDIQKIIFPKVK